MSSSISQSWACHLIRPSPIVQGEFILYLRIAHIKGIYGSLWILVVHDSVPMLFVLVVGGSGKREDIRWRGA